MIKQLWFELFLGFQILLFPVPFSFLLVDVFFVGFSNENEPAWTPYSGSGSGQVPFAAGVCVKPSLPGSAQRISQKKNG